MSQAGILDVESSNPQIPTQFDTDSGSAIPLANTLEVLGTNGITTSGAGNTVTITGVNATAGVNVGASQIGVAAFDSASFTVTAGFVEFIGGGGSDLTFPTDSGTAVPAADMLTIAGGVGMGTTGAGSTVTLNLDIPVSIANGGTNATSFTQGSVIFMGATAFSEDNATFFWDDTTDLLALGHNLPVNTLDILGNFKLVHTATVNSDHAINLEVNAAGFGDIKAINIDYNSGAISSGEEEEALLVNIDETSSTGGIISGYQILTTEVGDATIVGIITGVNVGPLLHNSGTFEDADDILNIAVDVTAALASGGTGNISVFVADNDTMTIGNAATFGQMQILLDTGASGAGILPVFEYSTGGVGFTSFAPTDGTNAFTSSGSILWEPLNLAGWVANATGFFEIRITRTRNALGTTPIIDELLTAASLKFIWNKDGEVNVRSLELIDPLTVENGGSGRELATAFSVLCGGVTDTDPQQSVSGLGTTAQVLTSNGAASLPTFQDAGSLDDLEFAGNDGSAFPSSDVINLLGSGGINSAGGGNTLTFSLDSPVLLTRGGTGRTSSTAYALICGGVTDTDPQQSVSALGTAAQVLTSNGAGTLPTFQDSGGGGGGLVQTIYEENATYISQASHVIPFDDTIPQNDEGLEVLSATITPTDAANFLNFFIQIPMGTNSQPLIGALFQDATVDALVAISMYQTSNSSVESSLHLNFRMVAGTTSATTFTVRGGSGGGNVFFNGTSSARRFGGVSVSNITITETSV